MMRPLYRLLRRLWEAPGAEVDPDDWAARFAAHMGLSAGAMIAQDAALIAPYALTPGETPEEMWSADYSKFVPVLIRAVQQLSAEVAALRGAND